MRLTCPLRTSSWLVLAAVVMSSGLAAAESNDFVARGREIARSQCARCHGIGVADESPMPDAPPFRRISERYPIDGLADAFAEGIVVGHMEMPAFEFQPQEIRALLAYLKSIQKPRRGY